MRGRVITDRRDLWKGGPFKALTQGKTSSGGRNSQGRTTSYHRGGGHKRLYRIIDFKRDIKDVQGTLERVEYDPNRTARIALVKYPAGMLRMFSHSQSLLKMNSGEAESAAQQFFLLTYVIANCVALAWC